MPPDEIANDPALEAHFDALPGDQRLLVTLLAVFFAETTRTDLTRAFTKLGHRSAGRTPKASDVLELLAKPIELGLVELGSHLKASTGVLHRAMQRSAGDNSLSRLAEVVRDVRPLRDSPDWEQLARELRIALYLGDFRAADAELAKLELGTSPLLFPFDARWVDTFPPATRRRVWRDFLERSMLALIPRDDVFERYAADRELDPNEHAHLVAQLVLRGRLDDARAALKGKDTVQADAARAWLVLSSGDVEAAIAAFEAALARFLREFGKKPGLFPDRSAPFFVAALLARWTPDRCARAKALCVIGARSSPLPAAFASLAQTIEVLEERTDRLGGVEWLGSQDHLAPIELLFAGLAHRWSRTPIRAHLVETLQDAATRASAAGYTWLARHLAELAGGPPAPGLSLTKLVARPERGSAVLDALERLVAPAAAAARTAPVAGRARLAWLVEKEYGHVTLRPIEQSWAKGGWSKGRRVALKRLYEEASSLDFLSDADRVVCATISRDVSYAGRYQDVSYSLDAPSALLLLAGQPNVLVGEDLAPAEIVVSKPRLVAARSSAGLKLTLEPAPARLDEAARVRLSGARVEVIEFLADHHAISAALGPKGAEISLENEGRLTALLRAISSRVTVESAIPSAEGASAPRDPALVALLRPRGDGLTVEVVSRPFGARGPTVAPGQGGPTLHAEIDGTPASVARDLDDEQRRLTAVLAACPSLDGQARVTFADRAAALAALVELKAAPDLTLEWPEGGRLAVSDAVDLDSLRLTIVEKAGVFELDGEVQIPGRDPLELGRLLDYLAVTPGRFVDLGADRGFLALSARLAARLADLAALSHDDRRLRFGGALASAVAELTDGAEVAASAAWRARVEAMRAFGPDPELPSTFRGELRPYQLDGYRWLTRLARLQAGACLADEMGLGKTVQAIALLLDRAPGGASLVVTPTSVLSQWRDELARFAPTLRVRDLSGPRREGALQDLAPFDVVLTSYAILPGEAEALAGCPFTVAILDEAHFIKNAETQRAKAALRLSAETRVALTGTPIENRLDELWSLFRFVVPGLLGPPQRFEQSFARPIQVDRDPTARARLKRTIAPFMLRRTKAEVLSELPPRVEVTLKIALEAEEAGLYEAVRREAIARLGTSTRRIDLLASLMRLRRAASHSRMVLPDSTAPSAKLAALGELLDELIPNGHKVLVFSQFVDHLTLVRELLDARGTTYQYLDGSTSSAARKAAVTAFQAGRGEVFLISLKAGGFGLNLTAADFVIHMDPWWNPASEDQASDRAHRIGQSRPVTIYRLVAAETIEAKILALHHQKRELAASLLEGGDRAASLDERELLALIREA